MRTSEFEAIVREHQAMVYSIAYNFFQDVSMAEEVAQDVFLQLYETGSTSPGTDTHIKRWLRKTTTHRSIDVWRRRGRRPEVGLEQLPEIPSRSREQDPLMTQRLQRLVGALPEKPRAFVILRYGEDMDVHEIGEILEMPVATVWSHLRRSIAILREKISESVIEVHHERVRTQSS